MNNIDIDKNVAQDCIHLNWGTGELPVPICLAKRHTNPYGLTFNNRCEGACELYTREGQHDTLH
jgi:hypothetical protein